MRMVQPSPAASRDLRRLIERLDGLPLRAATGRAVLDRGGNEDGGIFPRSAPWKGETDLDPGWVVACDRSDGAVEPLGVLAERAWWPSCSRAAVDALTRLWRHALAAGLAALRLAREEGDPDPEAVARAGVLHGLGLWAAAAVDPEWLASWLALPAGDERRRLERATLGTSAAALGRAIGERWGLAPLTVDAAWLHADEPGRLPRGTPEPRRLAMVQAAFRLAEETPWALGRGPDDSDISSHDPRVKILMAEVQARCRGTFTEPDAPTREERLTRENARLRLTVEALAAGQAARDRFLEAVATADPGISPEAWAERAGMVWCGEPGVSAARVSWEGPDETAHAARPPAVDQPLRSGRRTVAHLRLWTDGTDPASIPALTTTLPAWRAWASWLDRRVALEARLEGAIATLRELSESEEPRLRKSKLEALAEFAAGAGHELNNPLAVIVGRAQLLLARETDPQAERSLRAILTQAQRAHRILRDLMYVARPPEPRPKFCQPGEIWRSCLRDARAEAEERGVSLVAESLDPASRVWADPDALRHAADALLRNALEATPRGGTVRVSVQSKTGSLRWTVHDDGRGVHPAEAPHLFDPFYCGRQAGRGLGMGLPRVARFVGLVGGDVRWQSTPGRGSSFLVNIPVEPPPQPPAAESSAPGEPHDPRAADAS